MARETVLRISTTIHHARPPRFLEIRQRTHELVRTTSFHCRPDQEVPPTRSPTSSRFDLRDSVSGDAAYRSETIAMGHWLEQQLKALGVTTVLRDLGQQTLQDQRIELPPAILGKLGEDPKKKTVLLYGHYDVQPVR